MSALAQIELAERRLGTGRQHDGHHGQGQREWQARRIDQGDTEQSQAQLERELDRVQCQERHCTAQVQRGERVLVHGAAGGVGSALLELGKLAGLEMFGTASGYNHDRVSALGATPIDYRTEDFVQRVHQLTGEGVDVVFDPIGGFRQLWRSHQALKRNGRLTWFGVAAAKQTGLKVIPLTLLMVILLKLFPGGKQLLLTPDLGKDNAWYRQTLAELLDLLAAGKIKPIVAARFPLAEAARAHELLERGGYAGKVVLVTKETT